MTANSDSQIEISSAGLRPSRSKTGSHGFDSDHEGEGVSMTWQPPTDIEKTIQVLDSSIRRLQEERRRLVALLPPDKLKKKRDNIPLKEKFRGMF